MAVRSLALTYDDLLRIRETRDERMELIAGEIVVTPSPSLMHQVVVHRLAVVFDRVIVEPGLGLVVEAPFDMYLDEHNTLQPDVMVILRDRREIAESSKLVAAPNLVVEVVSPSSAQKDRGTKRDLYAAHDTPEHWLVDADYRQVTVSSNPRDGRYRTETTFDDTVVSATIPGVSVDLNSLFAPAFGD